MRLLCSAVSGWLQSSSWVDVEASDSLAVMHPGFPHDAVISSNGLRCYQCGQYTDGVGSITPCINHTDRHLKDCPKPNQDNCITRTTRDGKRRRAERPEQDMNLVTGLRPAEARRL
ncbi:hypothetical protein GE061_015144 [Apolygus lucorum]|uniref:Uncharacterized protein n=1 Tax=Apolygus lucorum TaxID=248454 RepID=A0A8S9XK90_APOLU|nr:hypothetical protein GE061_015144 [Apolygus lucorum]